ncbi:hypothetical protein CW731_04915 [Polaribacter sp. ALD11]|uniref:hypothetical protein n=1 Tax=Polaribacter sp. ALD11 TaxID=2058137 RepID=UPI000C3178A8|nr:hypothetical protein [Polaribacter sp. ALD11]AUC84671.1 hypothetical protein CW731_04915 [Polaribacter sp. ALD11]
MNFINKINKHLLENYPLIWNTRLVWMLAVNILVHLLFFMIGYASANSIEDLKAHYNLSNFFFETSTVYYNFLISIFILLVWVIYYLRNNAFKSVYSLKKGMLFKQFCVILLIFFISTTQYFSFKKGLVTKIKSLYSWAEVSEDIKTFNNIGLFFVHKQSDFEINKKKYPKPFPLKVAINTKNSTDNVDFEKPYLEYEGTQFQFYSINEKFWQEDLKEHAFLNDYEKNSFKYRNIEDISAFKELLHPSLYNYSETKFTIGQDSTDLKNQLKYFQNILDTGDESKIKEDLKKGLFLAKKYELSTNLNIETWFNLVNNKPNYLLKELLNTSNPLNKGLIAHHSNVNENISNTNIPYSKTLYFSFNNLDHFFGNVYFSYYPTFNDVIFYFLIVTSFFLSVLLFVFKTTNIKSLLLSFVASLVVLVIIIWLLSSKGFILSGASIRDYREFLIMMVISLIIILLSVVFYLKKMKKLLVSITCTLSVFALPVLFVFSSLAYSKYLDKSHKYLYPKAYDYISNFEKWFNTYGVLATILIWLLAVFIYATFIRKLNARAA